MPLDLALSQRRDQRGVNFWSPRHDQQAAGVLIESMHESRPRHDGELRIERQQSIL